MFLRVVKYFKQTEAPILGVWEASRYQRKHSELSTVAAYKKLFLIEHRFRVEGLFSYKNDRLTYVKAFRLSLLFTPTEDWKTKCWILVLE